MDYEELISDLRIEALSQRDQFGRQILASELSGAADAIEALLAERDAAVEELRGMCWCCVHSEKWDKAPAVSRVKTCKYMRERGIVAGGGRRFDCPHWKWRGPQKETAP